MYLRDLKCSSDRGIGGLFLVNSIGGSLPIYIFFRISLDNRSSWVFCTDNSKEHENPLQLCQSEPTAVITGCGETLGSVFSLVSFGWQLMFTSIALNFCYQSVLAAHLKSTSIHLLKWHQSPVVSFSAKHISVFYQRSVNTVGLGPDRNCTQLGYVNSQKHIQHIFWWLMDGDKDVVLKLYPVSSEELAGSFDNPAAIM